MIAVTFALPAESSAFVRLLTNRKRERWLVRGYFERQPHAARLGAKLPAPYPLAQGEEEASAHGSAQTARPRASRELARNTTNICVVHTGVGARECEKRLGEFLRREQPRLLISSGFCGGTSHATQPGDLLLGENFSSEDFLRCARRALPRALCGKLFSAERVIDPEADRYRIAREHGAVGIDMETEMIARLVAIAALPLLSLRVISDSPAAPFPAPPEVLFDLERQRPRARVLLPYLVRNPAAIGRLTKFSRQVARAKRELAAGLSEVIATVGDQDPDHDR